MEGNKDDALKCLKMGKEALSAGDRARSLKFITKARRLDPALPVHDLPSKVDSEPGAKPKSNFDEPISLPSDQSSIRQCAQSNSPSSSTVTYTEEQVTIVRQIKKKKDCYEILGLEKNCTEEDVKKAYRKLSLKVHPEKNKAPGAEEAFKSVSRAFQCLSNKESRVLLVQRSPCMSGELRGMRLCKGLMGFLKLGLMLMRYSRTSSLAGCTRRPPSIRLTVLGQEWVREMGIMGLAGSI